MHTNFKIAIIKHLQRYCIIKILCVGRVYGKGADLPEISAGVYLFLWNFYRNLCCSLLYLLLKLVWQTILGKYCVHLGVVLARLSQHINNPSFWSIHSGPPLLHNNCHLQTLIFIFYLLCRNLNIIWHEFALHNNPCLPSNYLQNTDIWFFRTFEQLHNLTFHLVVVILKFSDGNPHFISMQGSQQLLCRNKNIIIPVGYINKSIPFTSHYNGSLKQFQHLLAACSATSFGAHTFSFTSCLALLPLPFAFVVSIFTHID